MRHEYEKCYIGIPLRGKIEWAIAFSLFMMVEETRFRPNETKDKFWNPHITLRYLGRITNEDMKKISRVIRTHAPALEGSILQIVGPGIIGKDKKAFVYKVEKSKKLELLADGLRQDLPEYEYLNLPFLPHLTIAEIRSKRSLRNARKFIAHHTGRKVNFDPKSIVLFGQDKRRRSGVQFLDEVEI
jgi:2'-5' RNA ligase